jgi:hypothetical protein
MNIKIFRSKFCGIIGKKEDNTSLLKLIRKKIKEIISLLLLENFLQIL